MEVGASFAAGWAWSLRGTASRLEWLAGRNGSVRLDWGRSTNYNYRSKDGDGDDCG